MLDELPLLAVFSRGGTSERVRAARQTARSGLRLRLQRVDDLAGGRLLAGRGRRRTAKQHGERQHRTAEHARLSLRCPVHLPLLIEGSHFTSTLMAVRKVRRSVSFFGFARALTAVECRATTAIERAMPRV